MLPLVLWGGLIACVLKAAWMPLIDHDLWWQLACGREMLTQHVFLRSESFSHTLFGAPWINFEWLSQLVLFAIYSVSGITGVWAVKTMLCCAVILVIALLLRREHSGGPGLWILTALTFFSVQARLFDRVELASLLLFPTITALLASLRTQPLVSIHRTPWVVGGLMVLWVNLHGGFLYGMILIGAFVVGARWSGETHEIIAAIDRTFVVALGAILINPFGPHVVKVFVEHWVQIMTGPSVIQEWAMPTVVQAPFFWVLFVIAFGVLVAGFVRQQRDISFWAVAVFFFLAWGTRSIRNTAYAGLLVPYFLAHVARAWPALRERISMRQAQHVGWLIAIALLTAYGLKEVKKPWPSLRVQESRFPFAACRFLQQHAITGTLYNTYHFGGAIEWVLGRSTPVFMDGRYLFHPLLIDHNRLDEGLMATPTPNGWQQFLNERHVDIAITEYGPLENINPRGRTPFSFVSANLMFPRDTWALIYWDDTALVFLKRTPRFDEIIRQLEYTSVWPYNLEQMAILLKAGNVNRKRLDIEMKRNADEVPRSYVRQKIANLLMSESMSVE